MSITAAEARDFVAKLEALVRDQDRGTLSALRRMLGKPVGEAAMTFPQLYGWLPPRAKVRTERERPYFLLAALFAWYHQGKATLPDERSLPPNFGASFALLREDAADSRIERRFVALLNAHPDDLSEHLQRAVSLLRAKSVPVDWHQLLLHMPRWGSDERTVQQAWARGFWERAASDGEPSAATEAEEPEDAD